MVFGRRRRAKGDAFERAMDTAIDLFGRVVGQGHLHLFDQAVRAFDAAAAAAPPDSDERAFGLAQKGMLLHWRYSHAGGRKLLDETIGAYQTALLVAVSNSLKAQVYHNLCLALLALYDDFGDASRLPAAIEAAQQALTSAEPQSPLISMVWLSLGSANKATAEHTGDADALDRAIDAFRTAQRLAQADQGNVTTISGNLARALEMRFRRTGRLSDIDEAIEVARTSTTLRGLEPVERAGQYHDLALLVRSRYSRSQDVADLDEAVRLHRLAVSQTPPDHPFTALHVVNLGRALRARGNLVGDTAQLAEAVTHVRAGLAATPTGDPARAERSSLLGLTLRDLFLRTGERRLLAESLTALRASVAPGAGSRPVGRLIDLGETLRFAYLLDADARRIDEAITLLREAVAASEPGSDDQVDSLAALANALASAARGTDNPDAARESVAAGQRAVARARPDHPRWPVLAGLSDALTALYELTGDVAALTEAADHGRLALAALPPDGLSRAPTVGLIGRVLAMLAGRTQDRPLIEEAIGLLREAAASYPAAAVARHGVLLDLGVALQTEYALTGRSDAVAEAVALLREAAIDSSGASRFLALGNLGVALTTYYRLSGDTSALREGVRELRRAIAAAPKGHSLATRYRANVATGLWHLFEVDKDLQPLREGIAILRSVLTVTAPHDPERPRYETNLAGMLVDLARATGDREALAEAVATGQAASATGQPGHLTNFAAALSAWHDLVGDPRSLEAAIELTTRELALVPPESPQHGELLINLGLQGRKLAEAGNPLWLYRGLEAWERAARSTSATADVRFRAAALLGDTRADRADLPGALEAYTWAVELLAVLAWRGLNRIDREEIMHRWSGIAAEAAAVAITAGRPEQAVELLERGRSVLWSQALQTRADFGALHAVAPTLAERLADVGARLGAAETGGDGQFDGFRHAALAREWDDLVAKARGLPGLDRFLELPRFSDLAIAGREGPVVVINAAKFRCDALIIADDTVTTVPLAHVTRAEAFDLVNDYIAALDEEQTGVGRGRQQPRLTALLGRLWQLVVQPVLDSEPVMAAIGAKPVASGRLWWCPTGPFAVLPLHAAADPTVEGASAIDRVRSSYTPTVAALMRSRGRERADGPARLLAVAVPDAPGLPWLPNVEAEVDHVAGTFAGPSTRLAGATATRAAVMRALPDSTWAHFACHAGPDPQNPASNQVFLTDGGLTVLDFAGLLLHQSELVFLSACQTAFTGARLLDESVHLAAAMQVAGFRHVVATLWTIPDRTAPAVAQRVYAGLDASAAPSADHAGQALHDAVVELRRRFPDTPSVWASYIHIGP